MVAPWASAGIDIKHSYENSLSIPDVKQRISKLDSQFSFDAATIVISAIWFDNIFSNELDISIIPS
jgi:hypothetical protein